MNRFGGLKSWSHAARAVAGVFKEAFLFPLQKVVNSIPVNKTEMLDLYFLDARSKLLDIAAFLDRLDRAEGEADFRLAAFLTALKRLDGPDRAASVLRSLSDPTEEPIPSAQTQSALGAYNPN